MSDYSKVVESLQKKEHYRTIVFLIEMYQNKILDNGKVMVFGLSPFHFRYALMKNPGLSEEHYKAAEEFFNNYEKKNYVRYYSSNDKCRLEWFLENKVIRRGCVQSPQKLSNYLTHLVDKGILQPAGRRPNVRYIFSEAHQEYLIKNNIKTKIDGWNYPNILMERNFYEYIDSSAGFKPESSSPVVFPGFSESLYRGWYLNGFSLDFLQKLSKEEKGRLNQYLMNIEKDLWLLMELKYSKTKQIRENKLKKEIKEGTEETKLFDSDQIGFFYEASKGIVSNKRLEMINELFKKTTKSK